MTKRLLLKCLGRAIGNSYDKILTGISKKNNWKKKLTFEEISVIEFFLKSFFINFGYVFQNRKIDREAITKYYNKINKRFFFMDRFK